MTNKDQPVDEQVKYLRDMYRRIMGDYGGDPTEEHPFQDESKPYFWDDEARRLKAYIQAECNRARIDEVQMLRENQADFLKAQSGHIRNNNRWPNTRGAGEAGKNVLHWLDTRLQQLMKEGE